MVAFWKKKTPAEILANIAVKLDHMADHKKLSFLKSNIPVIRTAMENDPLPVPHIRAAATINSNIVVETMEKGHGYLFWHAEILDTLHDDDAISVDPANLSPAAQYFLDETRYDSIVFFHQIFALNPLLGLQKLGPTELFEKEIIGALSSLTDDENPHLYFSCYNQIEVSHERYALGFHQRLTETTATALHNMLLRDPKALLFPYSGQSDQTHVGESYLNYLPDGLPRERFIATHAEKIDAEMYAHLATLPESQMDNFLLDQKIIMTERVKMCFHAAANGDQIALDTLLASLDGNRADYKEMYSHYVGLPVLAEDRKHLFPEPFNPDPFTPLFEMICLTNPSASTTAEDKHDGAHSKHLWMIRRKGTVLSTSFTKAGMADYLKDQKELSTGPLPSVTDWNQFLHDAPPKKPDLDLLLE